MKLHSLLFLVTIVVACRAYFLPAKRRQEGLRLSARRGLHDRRTDSLDVEAQFSAESEGGGADKYKNYNLQPSAVGFVSGEGGGLVQAEAHASSGSQYGEGLQFSAGNEYGVDTPGEIIYGNHYGQLPASSEHLIDQTDQGLGIDQPDDTVQSNAEVQFGDTSQYSVEAQADKIIESNLEFNEGAKFNPESQVDSSLQDNGGAQQEEGNQTKYGTVHPRPNTSNGANQYSDFTSINAPTASQTVIPWYNEKGLYAGNRPIGTPQYGGNPYSLPQYLTGKPNNPYGGSYNGGSYNGGSYNAGSYNAGSYNAGSYNAGSYNAASYNGLPTAIGYAGKNKVPTPYNGGIGYNGLTQGNVPNPYVGNTYNSGPQVGPVNQANSYSQYGTLGGYNSSKFGSSQYSTAEGAYLKPGSNYGVPVSPHSLPPQNTGTQYNRDRIKKLTQNALSTQGRAPYSLINYNAEGFEAGTEKTNEQDAIISSGGPSTNIIENDVIPYQLQADSKVQSSKTDIVSQVIEGSKYSGEINSNTAQTQEEGTALARAHYVGESQSSSEVKQGTDTQYPKIDKFPKNNKYARQSQNVPSRVVKRNRSKKIRPSQESPHVTTNLQNLITEAPLNEDNPSLAINARFKHNYPHRDYGYERQRSPRWQG